MTSVHLALLTNIGNSGIICENVLIIVSINSFIQMISQASQWPAEGEYVDFKDKDTNDWQVGLVISRIKSILKVRTEGWSAKFDEFISANSNRLKPFRSFVRGYTGQQKNCAIRDHWRFSLPNHAEHLQQFTSFLAKQDKQPAKWNQLVRGNHYFYLDFLMSQTFTNNEEVQKFYEYLKEHIAFVTKYIEKIVKNGLDKWFETSEEDRTERESYYEIFDSIYIITGLYMRHLGFQKSNAKTIGQLFGEITHEKHVANCIKEAGLDSAYLKLLEVVQQHEKQKKSLPISFIYIFFRLFLPIQKALLQHTEVPFDTQQSNKEERKKISLRLFEVIKQLVERITSAQLKQRQNEKQIESLFNDMRALYFKYGLEKIAFQWIEKMKVKFAILLIGTDSLQRKIKGITKLKELFESSLISSQYQLYKLSTKEFVQIITAEQVLHKLFVQNQHPEILKKGGEFWQILFRENVSSSEDAVFVWDNCIKKHEAIRRIVLHLWIDLIPFAKTWLSKLARVVINSCSNESTLFRQDWQLSILLTFLQTILKFYSQTLQEDPERVQICTQLLQAGYNRLFSHKQPAAVAQKIPEYAKLINVCDQCNSVIKQCYVQIGKGNSLQLHISLLTNFYIETLKADTFLAGNALKIIFTPLKTHPQLSGPVFKLINEVTNFSTTLTKYQIFSREQFQQLWRIAQLNPQIKSDFYNWLLRQQNQGTSINSIFQINRVVSDGLRQEIFNNFLCDFSKLDYINLSMQEFNIFREFLLHQNQQEQKLQITNLMGMMRVIRIKNADITGSKYIWDIFMNCKNEEVLKELHKLIIVLHLHFHQSVQYSTRKNKVVFLMTKIQKQLKDAFRKGNQRLMKSTLALLKGVIDFIKQRQPTEEISSSQYYLKCMHKIQFEGKFIEIQTNLSSSYYLIKKKIADHLKVEITKVQLLNSKKHQIGPEYAQIPFCFMQDKNLQVTLIEENIDRLLTVIMEFLKTKLEIILIDMLEELSVCENIFTVLEELEIQSEQGEKLIDRLYIAIQKQKKNKKDKQITKSEIYLHLLLFRVLESQIDRPDFIDKVISKKIAQNLIELLGSPIHISLMINLLYESADLLFKIWKRLLINKEIPAVSQFLQNHSTEIAEKCIIQMTRLGDYINSATTSEEGNINVKKVKILFNCLNLLQNIKGNQVVPFLLEHSQFQSIIEKIYLNKCIVELRLIFTQKFKKFLKNLKDENKQISWSIQQKISNIFLKTLYPSVKSNDGLFSTEKKVIYFYNFIVFIIPQFSERNLKEYVLENNFFKNIVEYLRLLKDSNEPGSINYIFKAHLDILAAIYDKDPSLLSHDQMEFLLYDCLFFIEGKTTGEDIKCRHNEAIQSALKALLHGSRNSTKNITGIMKTIKPFHQLNYWRTSDDWAVSIEQSKKGKYIGLQNPGCICYLNSFIQQLFMEDSFRNALLNTTVGKYEEGGNFQLLRRLKEQFITLQYSEETALNPVPFTKSVKTADKKPMIRLFNQMDIDQFSSILFDRIQQQLKGLACQDFVKNIYGGIYAHQIVSHQCPHSSEREQQFLSIGLEVKKSINDSFGCLVRGQILDGQNKYHCERCDRKVRAQKILTIKRLPDHLIIVLKRFQFNYQIDAKIKINDLCEFPHELNLKKYSQQEIIGLKNQKEGQNQIAEPTLPDSHFQYQLKGIVVHTGSADSGHYYSLIRDKSQSWFEFNDSRVQPFDVKDIPEEAFGCKDSFDDKTKNAYLLFYERKVPEQPLSTVVKNQTIQENEQIIKGVLNQNKVIAKYRLLFSPQYSQFADKLWNSVGNLEINEGQTAQISEYLLTYFLLVRIRQISLDSLITFALKLQKYLINHPNCRNAFLQVFQNISYLQQVFVYCSVRSKSRVLAHLLTQVFTLYYDEIPADQELKDSMIHKILNNINILSILHGNINELNFFVRSIIEASINKNDTRIQKLLLELKYPKNLIINIMTIAFAKEEKQLALRFKEESKVNVHPLTQQSVNEGRKYITSQVLQSWKLLELLSIELNKEEHLQLLAQIKGIFMKQLITGNFSRIIYEGNNSRALYHLYKCMLNFNLIANLSSSLQRGLKDFQSTKFRPLLILILYIVSDKDTPEEIITKYINLLDYVQQFNTKYFLEVNLIYQWVAKFAIYSPAFNRLLLKQDILIKKMVSWMDRNSKPSTQLVKKHKHPQNDRLLNRINSIVVSADPKDYEAKTKKLKLFLYELAKQNIQSISDLSYEKEFSFQYKVGHEIKYFQLLPNKWKKGIIEQLHFGLLKIRFEKCKELSEYWCDDQRVRPAWAIQAQKQEEQVFKKIQDTSVSEPQKITQPEEEEDLYT